MLINITEVLIDVINISFFLSFYALLICNFAPAQESTTARSNLQNWVLHNLRLLYTTIITLPAVQCFGAKQ